MTRFRAAARFSPTDVPTLVRARNGALNHRGSYNAMRALDRLAEKENRNGRGFVWSVDQYPDLTAADLEYGRPLPADVFTVAL